MSFIRAVSSQWSKAEWSHQLVLFWQQDAYVRSLFAGATTMITVANVVAALKPTPEPKSAQAKPPENNPLQVASSDSNQSQQGLTHIDAANALFDCFLLLFVKELQYQQLSQAEAIIVQLAEYYAINWQKMPIEDIKLMNQSVQIINAMAQLKQRRHVQRKAQRNMGAH